MLSEAYRTASSVPNLVKRAANLAEQMKFKRFCSVEAGRLLQLLTSQMQSGVVGEIGTGCGVAAAWIVSALSSGTTFFAVESDPFGAAAARALFEPLLNVRIIQGDWREFLTHWRFGLVYAGIGSGRDEEPELLLQSLRSGGLMVLDGLTPAHMLPLERRVDPDPLRDFWLNDTRLISTEIMVSTSESVILAALIG